MMMRTFATALCVLLLAAFSTACSSSDSTTGAADTGPDKGIGKVDGTSSDKGGDLGSDPGARDPGAFDPGQDPGSDPGAQDVAGGDTVDQDLGGDVIAPPDTEADAGGDPGGGDAVVPPDTEADAGSDSGGGDIVVPPDTEADAGGDQGGGDTGVPDDATATCKTDEECVAALSPIPGCMKAVCDSATSTCVLADDVGGNCDDGNPCTDDDACGGAGSCAGTFNPSLSGCGEGDSCVNPMVLSGSPASYDGDTTGLAADFDGASCPGTIDSGFAGAGSSDAVFQYTAETTGLYQVRLADFSADPDGLDTLLYIYDACPATAGSACLAGDDQIFANGTESIDRGLHAGDTIFIVVDGWSNDTNQTGTFRIEVERIGDIETICDDQLDNDSDTFTDCDDPDCKDDAACFVNPCDSAIVVDAIPFSADGDTSLGSNDFSAAGCPGGAADEGASSNDHVYTFTPTVSGSYTFSLTGANTTFDSILYLAEGCLATGGACAASDDNPFVNGTESIVADLNAGTTYTIVVDGWSNLADISGAYRLTIDLSPESVCDDQLDNDNDTFTDCDDSDCKGVGTCPVTVESNCDDQVDNDNDTFTDCDDSDCSQVAVCTAPDPCASPIPIDALPFTHDGTTTTETANFNSDACPAPAAGRGDGSNDALFVFTAATADDYYFTLADLSADADGLDTILYLTDLCPSQADATCLASDDVPFGNGGELIKLSMTAGQTVHVVVDGWTNFSNTTGTYRLVVTVGVPPVETDCGDQLDNDNDTFTDCDDSDCKGDAACPSVETLCDDQLDNDHDTFTDCDDSDCTDDAACTVTEKLCDDNLDNDLDTFTDCDDSDCVNDPTCIAGGPCGAATVVDALPFTSTGDTSAGGAGGFRAAGCPGTGADQGAASSDDVFMFTPATAGTYTFTLNGSGTFFDSLLYVYEGCPGTIGAACLMSDDQVFVDGTESFSLDLTAGTVYFVIVDGWSNSSNISGAYELAITQAGAATESNCTDQVDNDNDTFTDCDDTDCSADTACAAGNPCDTATNVGALPFTLSGDTTTGADDFDSIACPGSGADGGQASNDDIYTFTPAATGDFIITLVGANTSFDSLLYIFEGCPKSGGTCIASDDQFFVDGTESITASLQGGTTYFIIVDGFGNTSNVTGAYELVVDTAPLVTTETICDDNLDNDNDTFTDCDDTDCKGDAACAAVTPCDAAVDATAGAPFSKSGDTTGGSNNFSSAGCPGSGANLGGASNDVLFKFTAAVTGQYQFSLGTATGSMDALLYVHSGCPGEPTSSCIASDDHLSPGGEQIDLGLTAGTTVYVVVDGWDDLTNEHGLYTLDITSSAAQVSKLAVNEVDYDQPGSDLLEFVEIWNPNTFAVDLSGYSLELVNGSSGAVYGTYNLSDAAAYLPAKGFLVVGHADVIAALPDGVLGIELTGSIQNGAPDGVRLMHGGARVDGLAYEGEMAGTGEGTTPPEKDGQGAQGGIDGALVRCLDGSDTDDNSVDFVFSPLPTPGAPNLCTGSGGVTPAYKADISPILAAKCTPCHKGNAAGSCSGSHCSVNFFSDTQKTPTLAGPCAGLGAATVAECINARVHDGSMPQGAGCTGDPATDQGNAACLTQAELEAVQAWVSGGAPGL